MYAEHVEIRVTVSKTTVDELTLVYN